MTSGFSSGAARITSVAYLLTSTACALASLYRAPCLGAQLHDRRIWMNFAIVLGLIAVNTLAGGEQAFVLTLRGMARADGWYELRRPVQLAVLALSLAGGLVVLCRLWATALRSNPPTALAFASIGIGALVSLAGLRLVSYHYADVLMNQPAGLLSLARWAELAGMTGVWLGALRKLMFTYSLR